jgi:hypothetical protein
MTLQIYSQRTQKGAVHLTGQAHLPLFFTLPLCVVDVRAVYCVVIFFFSFLYHWKKRDTTLHAFLLPSFYIPPATLFFIYFFSLHQIKIKIGKEKINLSGGILYKISQELLNTQPSFDAC